MTDRIMPVGSSVLEVAAAQACAQLEHIPVPLRKLWNAYDCPLALLPYLAWAWSVDSWNESWPEMTKRSVVAAAQSVHRHKGTIGALRRVIEPLGYLIRVVEWWQTDEIPGTFRLEIGVLQTGITDEMYQELERLIADAKPCSRHLIGLSINLESSGKLPMSVTSYLGDTLTVYSYSPEMITVTGPGYTGVGVHIIDNVRVNA